MSNESGSSFSFARVLLVAVPLAAAAAAGTYLWTKSLDAESRTNHQRNVLVGMLAQLRPDEIATDFKLIDDDGDLVADAPSDPAALLAPEEIVVSYIAQQTEEGAEPDLSNWDELLAALSEATGKPARATQFDTFAEQLEALRAGEVHLIGLSTGEVPLAVNTSGFMPLCTLAKEDGTVGYKMMLVTGADSKIKKLEDVAGKKVIFVRPTSNSGFKAAFVLLHEEAGLLPEQDYEWSFSMSYEDSVKAVIAGEADAAPMASDLLAKMVAEGEISEEDFSVLYESEAFPPAVLGCAYNLPAEMIEKIKGTMVEFGWAGTGMEAEFGPMGAAKFSPVNYKDDWANIRRIDSTVERILEGS